MRPQIAVLCDFVEEGWTSMDLVAEMLLHRRAEDSREQVDATKICPPMRRVFAGLPGAFTAERTINRFLVYPGIARRLRAQFDLFHIVDHSYAHIAHQLPKERTVVTCHDLDAFRCLLPDSGERRTPLHRKLASHTLAGLRRAARIFCDSRAVLEELLRYGIADPGRVYFVPLGTDSTCSPVPDAEADAEAARLLGPPGTSLDLLHVGSTAQRKRIDILLDVVGAVREHRPEVRLIRVGGALTSLQHEQARARGLNEESLLSLPFLRKRVLAAVYRRAALVLQPSDAEGFGLPVAEALASGVPVVASDLAVLRETGGESVRYCPVADIGNWTNAVLQLLAESRDCPDRWQARRLAGLRQARRFSTEAYSSCMTEHYRQVLRNVKEAVR